jgi:hypothetical protein
MLSALFALFVLAFVGLIIVTAIALMLKLTVKLVLLPFKLLLLPILAVVFIVKLAVIFAVGAVLFAIFIPLAVILGLFAAPFLLIGALT